MALGTCSNVRTCQACSPQLCSLPCLPREVSAGARSNEAVPPKEGALPKVTPDVCHRARLGQRL